MKKKTLVALSLISLNWSCGSAKEDSSSRNNYREEKVSQSALDGETEKEQEDAKEKNQTKKPQKETSEKSQDSVAQRPAPPKIPVGQNNGGMNAPQQDLLSTLQSTISSILQGSTGGLGGALNPAQLQGLIAALNNLATQAVGGGAGINPAALAQTLLSALTGQKPASQTPAPFALVGGGLADILGPIGDLFAAAQAFDLAGAIAAITDIIEALLGLLGL